VVQIWHNLNLNNIYTILYSVFDSERAMNGLTVMCGLYVWLIFKSINNDLVLIFTQTSLVENLI